MLLQALILFFQVFALGLEAEKPGLKDPGDHLRGGILRPRNKDNIQAGSRYTIRWDPSVTKGSRCRISLHDTADGQILQTLAPIVGCATGSSEWPVWTDAERSKSYFITIRDDDGSVLQKSGEFHILPERPKIKLNPEMAPSSDHSSATTTSIQGGMNEHTSKAGTWAQPGTPSTGYPLSTSSTALPGVITIISPYVPQATMGAISPTTPDGGLTEFSFTVVYSRSDGDVDIGQPTGVPTPPETHDKADAAHRLELQVGLTIGLVFAILLAAAAFGLAFWYRRRAKRAMPDRAGPDIASKPNDGGQPNEHSKEAGDHAVNGTQEARMVRLYRVSAKGKEPEEQDVRQSIGLAN